MSDTDVRPSEVEGCTIPYTRFRVATARRLTESVTTKPHVTLHAKCEVERIINLLQHRQSGSHLTITHLIARTLTLALVHDNSLNGWVRDDCIYLFAQVNLALAVQTTKG